MKSIYFILIHGIVRYKINNLEFRLYLAYYSAFAKVRADLSVDWLSVLVLPISVDPSFLIVMDMLILQYLRF